MSALGDSHKLLGDPSPPPYHEAARYSRPRVPRRFLRIISIAPLTLALLWALHLFWYIWTGLAHPYQGLVLSALGEKQFEAGLASCVALTKTATKIDPHTRKENPRWNPISGQNKTLVLRNVTLFDGESFLAHPMDVVLEKGLVVSVKPTADANPVAGANEVHLYGAYVTPGLVDMHSHHMIMSWPELASTEDSNEMHPDFGPLTPFVRAVDSMKAYDIATRLIASGGVTSSLVIPGSGNIMGGEGTVVKNAMRPGPSGEYVVEEVLLEHGIAVDERHRYMKMACGENPKYYGHTRMGNVWLLRKWLARAKELVDKQDAWCEAATMASSLDRMARASLMAEKGGFPEELELESTAGMLRGRVAMHNHCYEPEDMETMLRVSHEFGFRVRAFHHAIAAWQVPEMIKEYGENVTIATFAEFALYKQEAYAASLWAGKILNDHDVPVAYKSDHSMEDMSSKYLLSQAAIAHSFGLPQDKALQAVTSIPAHAIDMDDRVGFIRTGYDADVVVWDAHPLSVGATPRQVYIDGIELLDPNTVEKSMAQVVATSSSDRAEPAMRATVAPAEREDTCAPARTTDRTFVVTGIERSFLHAPSEVKDDVGDEAQGPLTLVVEYGAVTCLGAGSRCDEQIQVLQGNNEDEIVFLRLNKGHLTHGLTAVTSTLGIAEISTDDTTGDGVAKVVKPQQANLAQDIPFAKYAVSLGGDQVKAKTFARARLGGVTRAVQAPQTAGGLITGVSTGMRTGLHSTLLNGGLFRDDVALHVELGETAKLNDGTVGMAIEKLRVLLRSGGKNLSKTEDEDDSGDSSSPWARVANGSLPLVVKANSNHDIQQVILLKKDFPDVNAVIFGGHEAHLFAKEIANAKIPVILTATRPGPDSWTKKESLPGPPLSRSPADVLTEAGVFFAVALNTDGGPPGDSRIQSLALEASWAAKYAGLDDDAALSLVTRNVEAILGLEASDDIVVWEGNPLQFGTPVLAFQAEEGRLVVGSCWPNDTDE